MKIEDCLRLNPHLGELPPSLLEALAFAFVEEDYPDGHELVREGRRGRLLFLLLQGEISVVARGREREVIRLAPGAIFGLVDLFDGSPSATTCRARGPVRVGELQRSTFSLLANNHAPFGRAFRRAIGSQLAADFRRIGIG